MESWAERVEAGIRECGRGMDHGQDARTHLVGTPHSGHGGLRGGGFALGGTLGPLGGHWGPSYN